MTLGGVVGCQTLGDVVQAKAQGGGTTQVYPVEADQAWKIAMAVFRWEGSDAIEEHRDEGSMLTSSGMNLITAGAVMGAWVDPVGHGQTTVTVVTKRRIAANLETTRELLTHEGVRRMVHVTRDTSCQGANGWEAIR